MLEKNEEQNSLIG